MKGCKAGERRGMMEGYGTTLERGQVNDYGIKEKDGGKKNDGGMIMVEKDDGGMRGSF